MDPSQNPLAGCIVNDSQSQQGVQIVSNHSQRQSGEIMLKDFLRLDHLSIATNYAGTYVPVR